MCNGPWPQPLACQVVVPVIAAVALLTALVRTKARTSKRTLYRSVDPGPSMDVPSGIARMYDGSLGG